MDTRSQVQCTTRQKADPSVSKSTNVVVLISPVTKEMIYYMDLKETLDTG